MDKKLTRLCLLVITLQVDFAKCVRLIADETFVCPEPDGVFPSTSTECSATYYLCVDNVGYEQHCPGTTVFDPKSGLCVNPQLISCQGVVTQSTSSSTTGSSTTTISTTIDPVTDSTSTISTTASTGTPPDFSCPTPDGFYAIPNTCGSTYYTCIGGNPYLTTCPGGSIFDPIFLVCVSAESATCNFKCPEENGFFPIKPGQCNNAYYACIGGEPYLEYCPNNSVFDPTLNYCVIGGSGSC